MRRTAIGLTMVVLMLLLNAHELMGGGSGNPPQPGKKITGPAVSAIIVMDPHDPSAQTVNSDATQKAQQASVRLQKGAAVSGATFRIPSGFEFVQFGCDVAKTNDRFVNSPTKNNKLTDWIPSAIVAQLFADLGITVTAATNVPVITDVDNAICTSDPENTFVNPGPGILSFQAVIQFQVPQ